ncbi:ABC transporter substrate-binding protein [Pontivivens insulae]|uniref:Phosphoglycerate transport regulatory protein PgtC n=1 Tax=Pontivivens insulae TaxID=1639689 RepID=A0A2R8A6N9_9RHOB|nr:ABC transporter substrate-binding protein [Pontivivens insulae]RED18011.1 iron(III) transport system substrate-binding protein [Pontivivens insulae]SPF27904.1 Phosphoglycerate transport regulatory protein PgtC [Pontivivens insulae]
MRRILASTVASIFLATPGLAEELHIICSAEQDWCDQMAAGFEAENPEIDVLMVRKSTGEALAQIRAEAGNPKVDVWWGGTGDPHLIASTEGLIQQSGVPVDGLRPWATNMLGISEERTVGIYAGALGIAYNPEILAERGIEPPNCWEDLAHPRFAGEVQSASPHSSGTAYTQLATIVQIFGMRAGFDLLARIGQNVNDYTSSGSAPSKAVARGETGVSIGFMHDMVKLAEQGLPIEIVTPCEGTGYEVGAVSVIENARNFEAAQAWVAYALRADVQTRAAEVRAYQVPSNSAAAIPDAAPDFDTLGLIAYDFVQFGNAELRAYLLERWDEEVGSQLPSN